MFRFSKTKYYFYKTMLIVEFNVAFIYENLLNVENDIHLTQ